MSPPFRPGDVKVFYDHIGITLVIAANGVGVHCLLLCATEIVDDK